MPETDASRRFMEAMNEWLVTLPHDLKILYEAAAAEDLKRDARELAVGGIISTISADHLPGVLRGDFTNYCDGAIVLRLVARAIATADDEYSVAFRERFADFYDRLPDDIALCEAALGDMFEWLQTKAAAVTKLEYKGKKIGNYLDDDDASAFLYEEGLEFQTEYEVDEDILSDRLKKTATILDALEKRRQIDRF